MDALTALKLQIEWGANEALEVHPVDRLRPPPAHAPSTRPAPLPAGAAPPVPGRETQAGRETPADRAARVAATATTLEELRAAIAGFDGTPLRGTATNLLFLEGDPVSGLLLVTEAPNADADRSGSLLSGPVGDYLQRMLRSIGLERDNFCLAPLIPWRPPGDRPPSQAEIATCLPFLYRIIRLTVPRRIVALGPLPVRALLGATPMRRRTSPAWQAATIPGNTTPIPTLPMPSPAILLRVTTQRRSAWADLRCLRHSLDTDLTQK